MSTASEAISDEDGNENDNRLGEGSGVVSRLNFRYRLLLKSVQDFESAASAPAHP
jgi:hypothetical protein